MGFTAAVVALALGLALWLTHDGDDGGGGSQPIKIEELAADAGCSNFTQNDSSDQLFVRESGSCRIDGQDAYLYTYDDDKAQQRWLDAEAEFGGGVTVSGALWAVNVLRPGLAERLADKLGGHAARARPFPTDAQSD